MLTRTGKERKRQPGQERKKKERIRPSLLASHMEPLLPLPWWFCNKRRESSPFCNKKKKTIASWKVMTHSLIWVEFPGSFWISHLFNSAFLITLREPIDQSVKTIPRESTANLSYIASERSLPLEMNKIQSNVTDMWSKIWRNFSAKSIQVTKVLFPTKYKKS